jgi:predicted O-linked N-acetylglucosamine transferase (SPINDLY family)
VDAPDVALLPALRKGYLTFGSLSSLFKFNAKVFDLWSDVLRALPNSRLLMFRNTLTNTARANIRQQFAQRGVSGDRLDLRQGPYGPGYLGVYNEIDVSLDTLPCTGGVTTCESLWMGVPVISLCGIRPVARNSAAHLTHVGLADWVVHTPEQYVALAAHWANSLPRLAELRAGLRDRMLETLCDAERFTRGLEDAYFTMWQTKMGLE